MELRLAAVEEYAAVGDLTVAAYARFTTGANDAYIERLRDAAARGSEAELWVAVDGDQLLGTVTSCPPGSPWHELAGARGAALGLREDARLIVSTVGPSS